MSDGAYSPRVGSSPTPQVAAAATPSIAAKRRRRSATGLEQDRRRAWGAKWGSLLRDAARQLRAEGN